MVNESDYLNNLRHSLAHILASAVLYFYPEAKLGVGPVTENGFYYDFLLKKAPDQQGLLKIENYMRELIHQNFGFQKQILSIKKAREFFKKLKQPFKVELVDDLAKYGTTEFSEIKNQKSKIKKIKSVTIYRTGEFIDLCRGGHVKNTKEIHSDAFKLTNISRAFWRGDQKREALIRIYGVAFENKKELEKYLWQQEEAKRRDHRVLGEKLKLFTFSDLVGPGLPLWLPNGTIIRDEIEKYAKEIEEQWGYQRVATPHIAKEDLFKVSGHIPYYTESMYPAMRLDDGNYYLKAMNCPHTHMIYRSQPHSYRDLPLRFAEYGTVYRYELSGTLTGLLRVRGFTQNDAHIYCREDQAEEEFLRVMKLHEFWYKDVFGIKDYYIRLSLPKKNKDKYVNVSTGWEKAVTMIKSFIKKSGVPFVEAEGEAAFYGPKADFQIKSVIGREETASTNQLDFLATKRFDLTYKDKDGKDKPIYVIHRAPLGSHERFVAFLIEHYAGAFPLWLSPLQAAVLPITLKQENYARKVFQELKQAGIRTELSQANETLAKRVLEYEEQKVPYLIVVGQREAQANTIALRARGKKNLGEMKMKELIGRLKEEIRNKRG